ncbi:protein-disulfide reductase DsbD domain-containing protein [Pedobacter sp. V48]|uniref:protein-disulfide reductase DsbD domain-containing protein n=1 Tax=Pedobacter sp. V48 TaxID=509635 RepID=UPI0003E4A083|nr:protein-disulfide reductase DsbD domain-containing protein [Pedobacter sp. V48]ETZ23253.1 hypothetical protein N824_17480 [Pedobacter sp. V48]
MKKIILIVMVSLFTTTVKSQILKPVKWSYAAKKTSSTQAILYIKASLESGWHIYALNIPKGDQLKTIFTFSPEKTYKLKSKTLEPKPITKFEKTLDINVSYFEKSVVFNQKIQLAGSTATVKGEVEFMVCNDQQCLPRETLKFSIPVK